MPHYLLSYNGQTSVSSLHQNCPPHAPLTITRWPRVCTISTSDSVIAFIKGTSSPLNRGHDCKDWHKGPPIIHGIYCGVSGQAVATKYSTCCSLNRHHLHHPQVGCDFIALEVKQRNGRGDEWRTCPAIVHMLPLYRHCDKLIT